jgi:hypothetical protein
MSLQRQFFVYMLASKVGGAVYIGVTSILSAVASNIDLNLLTALPKHTT